MNCNIWLYWFSFHYHFAKCDNLTTFNMYYQTNYKWLFCWTQTESFAALLLKVFFWMFLCIYVFSFHLYINLFLLFFKFKFDSIEMFMSFFVLHFFSSAVDSDYFSFMIIVHFLCNLYHFDFSLCVYIVCFCFTSYSQLSR